MKRILLLTIMAGILSACGKEKCEYSECAMTAPATEIQSLQSYLQSNNITATQHCSGTFYVIDQQGNGDRPTACDQVSVRYQGRLTNGTVFDPQGGGMSTASFNLGGLIPGFKNALLQLKSGGKITIYIPPTLGYGSQQVGNIPPNSNLIFTVELLEVQ